MDAKKAQEILRQQIAKIPINEESATKAYYFLFTGAPDMRRFFKGAENIDPNDVHKSERFQKQGVRLLTAVNISIEIMHNDELLKHFVNDRVDRHRPYHIPFDVIKGFFVGFMGWVEEMTGEKMSDEQRTAWMQLDLQWMGHYKRKSDQLGIS